MDSLISNVSNINTSVVKYTDSIHYLTTLGKNRFPLAKTAAGRGKAFESLYTQVQLFLSDHANEQKRLGLRIRSRLMLWNNPSSQQQEKLVEMQDKVETTLFTDARYYVMSNDIMVATNLVFVPDKNDIEMRRAMTSPCVTKQLEMFDDFQSTSWLGNKFSRWFPRISKWIGLNNRFHFGTNQ
jgi:hypothetical protein